MQLFTMASILLTQNTFPKSQSFPPNIIQIVCYKSRNPSLQEIWNYMTKSHTDVKMDSKLFILPSAHTARLILASIGHTFWLSNRISVGVLCTISKIDPWNFQYTIFHFPFSWDVTQCAWKPKGWKTQSFKIKETLICKLLLWRKTQASQEHRFGIYLTDKPH